MTHLSFCFDLCASLSVCVAFNRSLMQVPAHLDNREERLCVVLRVLQNVICKVNKQKWQKCPWWVGERLLWRMWWPLFVSETTLTQQLPHHTADGISVVLSRFICKYKPHFEDKVNLVKSWSCIHCVQKVRLFKCHLHHIPSQCRVSSRPGLPCCGLWSGQKVWNSFN